MLKGVMRCGTSPDVFSNGCSPGKQSIYRVYSSGLLSGDGMCTFGDTRQMGRISRRTLYQIINHAKGLLWITRAY